jgi:hypothetical protein
MKSFRGILALACGFVGLTTSAHAQWVEQSISLRPGWNAVFLEVDPSPEDCDTLFAGLPVESVWDWNRQDDSVQFLQDPASLIPGTPGWLTWFPGGHPVSSQTTLFILRDGRPYLIKLADNAPTVTWTVKGRPSLRRITWQAGAVNFVGFHVAEQAPTFATLFASEVGLVGQPIYRLGASGRWEQVSSPTTERPRSGEAYWVRCRLPARWAGTVEVGSGSRQGLVFTGALTETSLRVRNSSSAARNVSVRLLNSAPPPAGEPALAGLVPLEYWKSDYANVDLGWEPLPAILSYTGLPPGAEWNVRLAVRRPVGAVVSPGAQYQGLLEVTDDLGARWVVGVAASSASGEVLTGPLQPSGAHDNFRHAGLWVGEAVINAVSQPAHPGDPIAPRPAGSEFSFRLIVHVDGGGIARLLQRVYLVRKPATMVPDPEHEGYNVIDQPARTVVVTDEALIPVIIGSGAMEGRRISSAAFAFDQPIPLSGGPFGEGTLGGVVTLDYRDALNPFRHGYHPDHDNLDERFESTLPEGGESFTVTRQVAMEFTGIDPLGLDPPGWGEVEIGGSYRETFRGLHRSAIETSGHFRLVRVVRAPALNDSEGGMASAAFLLR